VPRQQIKPPHPPGKRLSPLIRIKRKLKKIQYWPHLIDGYLAKTIESKPGITRALRVLLVYSIRINME